MVRIGPKWVARGLAQFIGDAARMENVAAGIAARSGFMRLRGKTMQREISELRNRIAADGGRWSAVQDSFYYFIQRLQQVVDIPTWLGAYEKAQAEGNDEARSVSLADQAVLDAQGGGQIKDLAAVQRGGSLQKFWTPFYSFFNAAWNLNAESFNRTRFRDPASVARYASDFLLLNTAPVVLGVALKEAVRGNDSEPEEWAEKLAREQLGWFLGFFMLSRELSGVASGYNYSGPAGTRLVAELSKLSRQAEQGEVDEPFLKRLNNVAGILIGYPAGQVQRTVEGFTAWLDGEAPLSAIVFGPPKN